MSLEGLPDRVEIVEVGPREGFQYEGIGDPDRIPTRAKVDIIDALSRTGLRRIQVTSFVHPGQVPQMADAEAVCAGIDPVEGVEYTSVYLNDVGLRRAMAAPNLTVDGKLTLTASEAFSKRNQNRTLDEDRAMQGRMAELYREVGVPVTVGSVMAAFGCNYEGRVPATRVIGLVGDLVEIAERVGSEMTTVVLADTMGWGHPGQVIHLVDAIRARWPALRIGLHLHDTRGLGMANAFAGLSAGVDLFDASIAGIGGCPFAGHRGAAGNIATEELAFLCERLEIETGVSIERLVECARDVETVLGRPLSNRLAKA